MQKFTVDLNGIDYFTEVHKRFEKSLNFPDYYGQNLSALWDVLYLWYSEKTIVEIIGVNSLKGDAKDEFISMIPILDRVKAQDENFDYRIVD
jgi:RNAse (barnase) inhibitor barstar